MKYSKLFTALQGAILLGAASLVLVANANSDEIVQTAGGVSYVSGGVGTASLDRLSSLSRDFNLKLVFALKSGDYVSDVKVTIANAAGKTLLDTMSEGPWFFTKLPMGNYQIIATFAGNAEKRTIALGAADQRARGQSAEVRRFGVRRFKRRQARGDRLQLSLVAGELEQGERIAARKACLNAAGNIHARKNS